VQSDLAGIRVDEVTLRQQIEVRGDLVGADAGNGFGDEFLLGHLQTLPDYGLASASPSLKTF
jgi:hypothetical protein